MKTRENATNKLTEEPFKSSPVPIPSAFSTESHSTNTVKNVARGESHKESRSIGYSLWNFHIGYRFLSQNLRFLFAIHKHLTQS